MDLPHAWRSVAEKGTRRTSGCECDVEGLACKEERHQIVEKREAYDRVHSWGGQAAGEWCRSANM